MNDKKNSIDKPDDTADKSSALDEKRRNLEDLAEETIIEGEQAAKSRKEISVEPPRHPVKSKEEFLQRELASDRDKEQGEASNKNEKEDESPD